MKQKDFIEQFKISHNLGGPTPEERKLHPGWWVLLIKDLLNNGDLNIQRFFDSPRRIKVIKEIESSPDKLPKNTKRTFEIKK